MREVLLPLAVAAVCVSVPVFAELGVYGKINVSVQSASEGDDSTIQISSNASHLGFKGTYELDNGLEAFYKIEFETFVDDGDKDGKTVTQRYIYGGVKGSFGSVMIGRFDAPLKTAQNKVDLFDNLKGDIKNVISGNDNSLNNAISYKTNAMNGIVGNVAVSSRETDGADNAISASLAWSNKHFYIAAAVDQDVAEEESSAVRLVSQYNHDAWQVGLLFETYDDDAAAETVDGWLLSGQYKTGNLAYKLQYGASDIMEEGATSLSVGADYKLAKKAKVFAYITQNESDAGTDDRFVGVGTELEF
jgi:predicted porin